jgi:uncharacterized LabA/DUF88 family protein
MNTYSTPPLTTYAFVDAANMIYRNTDPIPWKIDLKKLISYLQKRFDVQQTYYFGGVDDRNAAQLKLYSKLEEWGYILKLNPVKKFVNDRGEWYIKADVDSRMTFEMMRLLPEYDRCIVITGDGDYYWVLQYILEQKQAGRLLASPSKTAKELKQLFSNHFINLDDARTFLEYMPQY